MSLKKRVEKLENEKGAGTPIVRICWHPAGAECDCPPADTVVTWDDLEGEQADEHKA